MTYHGTDFEVVYNHIAGDLIYQPDYIVAGTREILDAKLVVDNIDNPFSALRNASLEYALAELVWYWAGSPEKSFIGKFGAMWNKISDDGFTNNSAYGYVIKHKHGFNQLNKIIELLTLDKYSRRAVININVPNRNVIETKDEPCTIALQFNVRPVDGVDKLFMTVMMRSNDIWYGLPYDIVYFTSLQKYVARALSLPTGSYTHFATSLHLYDRNLEDLKNNINYSHLDINYKIDYLKIADNAQEYYNDIIKLDKPKKDILKYMIDKGVVVYES